MPITMAKKKKKDTGKTGKDTERLSLILAGENVKWHSHSRKQLSSFLHEIKHAITI